MDTLRELARLLFDLVVRSPDDVAVDSNGEAPWFSVHHGGERGIVVWVSKQHLDIRTYCVAWQGPHTPVDSSRPWRRVNVEGLTVDALGDLLKLALTSRAKQYRRCEYCGELVAPEHRFSGSVCHGCATREFGIIY